MTVAYKARVWEVGTITGAGPYNLPNVANTEAYRTVAGSGLTSGQSAIFCIQDTVTNAWELSLFTYTSGSPGTLARVQFLESSTGSAVTFAGNSTNITLEIPSPVLNSAGSTSSGLIPALNASGVLDSSFGNGLGGVCSVYQTGTQTLSSTLATITFDTIDFDTLSAWNTSTYEFKPSTAGYYLISVTIYYQDGNNNSIRAQNLLKNGTAIRYLQLTYNSPIYNGVLEAIVYLNGSSDYIQVQASSSAGGNVGNGNLLSRFYAAQI